MGRILIIEDEEDVREELKERVETMGHEVEEAGHVKAALEKLEDLQFDLVLLDLAIPTKFGGVASADYGRTLLKRIVTPLGAPPVIAVTAHEFEGYEFVVTIIEEGAETFVAKPLKDRSLEEKIENVLLKSQARPRIASQPEMQTKGGILVLHEDGIDFRGKTITNARNIRKIIEIMMVRKGDGHYPVLSGAKLAEGVGRGANAPTMASAIKWFRDQTEKLLGCSRQGIIASLSRGGYQLAPDIEVKLGREDAPLTQIQEDRDFVLQQIKLHGKRTRKQISDENVILSTRIKAALSALCDERRIRLEGSGAQATYSLADDA